MLHIHFSYNIINFLVIFVSLSLTLAVVIMTAKCADSIQACFLLSTSTTHAQLQFPKHCRSTATARRIIIHIRKLRFIYLQYVQAIRHIRHQTDTCQLVCVQSVQRWNVFTRSMRVVASSSGTASGQ